MGSKSSASNSKLRPKAITFDCYGTLIDWEVGIKQVFGEILSHRKSGGTSVDTVFRRWREVEFALIKNEYKPYRSILRESVVSTFREFGFGQLSEDEQEALGNAMPTWRPFPEIDGTLQTLKTLYPLAVISNVDNDIIARNLKFLNVRFDHVMTAEQARAYKPSRTIFERAWAELHGRPEDFLHVGASLHVDVITAARFGCSTVWVNRTSAQANLTDTEADIRPQCVVEDLSGLLDLVSL